MSDHITLEVVDVDGAIQEAHEAAQIVSDHENEHVAVLRKALGRAAIKKPTFDFNDGFITG